MNAFVRKEIRLLLPNLIACVLLAGPVWLAVDYSHPLTGAELTPFVFLLAVGALVGLSLDSFGREMSANTFGQLLAQPIPRARIWWTKTLLLLLAVGVSLVTFWVCYCLFKKNGLQTWGQVREMVSVTGTTALTIYAGGLWTVLLFRQVAAAFWFTLLTPTAIMVITLQLLDWSGEQQGQIVTLVLLAYSVAGFFFARWLFLRAQDVQWSGGDITLPAVRGLKWWGERPREPRAGLDDGSSVVSPPHRVWRPRAALLVKELQLHQSQFLIAGLLLVVHLGVLALHKFGGSRLVEKHEWLELVLVFLAFWGLWLVMPLLVGCAAVAEERKLGTLEGQLCLPARRRSQFTTKLGVVLLLSVLLGAVVPLLLEGSRITPKLNTSAQFDQLRRFLDHSWQILLWDVITVCWHKFTLILLVAGAATMGTIAYYASSLSRNTLQALAPAVLGVVLVWLLLAGALRPEIYVGHPLWRGWLIYLIGLPTLVLTLLWLMYANFKSVQVGWSSWRRNLLVLTAALALVVVSTTLIYHRAWEWLTPQEPPHGAARLTVSERIEIQSSYGPTLVKLPDGRVWEL
jgi:ABC-type transport system involved in multi-copper enzyme maturation permease subunit